MINIFHQIMLFEKVFLWDIFVFLKNIFHKKEIFQKVFFGFENGVPIIV